MAKFHEMYFIARTGKQATTSPNLCQVIDLGGYCGLVSMEKVGHAVLTLEFNAAAAKINFVMTNNHISLVDKAIWHHRRH